MNKERSTAPLLVMRNICKRFSGGNVLEDVQFHLGAGEVHVLAGENGAGKSTLIKILGGLYGDYSGTVELEGRKVQFKSPGEASMEGISIIHQELSLIPAMTVGDNIFLGRELPRWKFFTDRRSQDARGKEVLRKMGLDLELSRPVEHFPVAIQQMIEIVKALSFDARIIVMDEPTSALGEEDVGKLFSLIRELKRLGHAIIFISHRLEEIYRIADRITVLRDGRNAGTGTAADVDQDTLVRWMAGREVRRSIQTTRGGERTERIAVKNLSLLDPSEGRRSVFGGVTFTVRSGEVVGFAGVRGSGNSELFNALFGACGGLLKGEVAVNGVPVKRFSPARLIRQGCILLTNDRKKNGFIPGMNIIQNATLAALRKFSGKLWLRPKREEKAAADQMRLLNLRADSLRMDVDLLSGGNIQKVILGKWLLTGPSVLMLDDPTRGIDIETKEEIYTLIRRYAESGCAVMLISSELSELLSLSDRVIVMHRGRISDEFSREEATREKVLKAAMRRGD